MKLGKLFCAVALLAFQGQASAALVTLFGDKFDVVYDDQALGLFGTPTLSGDQTTIIFSPLAFRAESSNGQGFVNAQSDVQLDIILKDPTLFGVNSVKLMESGDYRLTDIFGGQGPVVSAVGQLRVTNLQTGTDFQEDLFDTGNILAPENALTAWNQDAEVTNLLAPWLFVSGGQNTAPDVRVRIQDRLTAGTFAAGQTAFIQKKGVSETIALQVVSQSVVPVPAAVWLLGSALAAMGTISRRRA